MLVGDLSWAVVALSLVGERGREGANVSIVVVEDGGGLGGW